MKILRMSIVLIIIAVSLSSCEIGWFDVENHNKNAVIIKPSVATKAADGKISIDSTVVYPIGSAFWDLGKGGTHSFDSYSIRFYKELFTSDPPAEYDDPLVVIYGLHSLGLFELLNSFGREGNSIRISELNNPNTITEIQIKKLDETLGFESNIVIKMDNGKYDGSNEKITDVSINRFNTATTDDDGNFTSKDADIDIVITSIFGGVITLHFSNEEILPSDKYY